MSIAVGHGVMCPGIAEKPECADCTSRKLRIKGHLDNWLDDPNSGESIRTYYVSPPCLDPKKLIKHVVRVGQVRRTARAVAGNMKLTMHTKLVEVSV